MANNGKITTNYYCSKAGNDANAGTSWDLAKVSLAGVAGVGAAGNSIGFGTGLYFGNFSANRAVLCDGFVKFLGDNATNWNNSGNTNILSGGYFEGYNSVTTGASNSLTTGCIFESTYITQQASGSAYYSFCIFINCTFAPACNILMNHCIFINTNFGTFDANTFVDSSYFDAASSLQISTSGGFGGVNNNNNNIQGYIRVRGAGTGTSGVIQDKLSRYFNLSIAGSGGTGTIGDPFRRDNTAFVDFNLAAHKLAYPGLNVNSISEAPLFNNASKKDFTLQQTSPHLLKGSGGSNIGGTNFAQSFYAGTDISAGAGAVITNLSGTNDFIIASGTTGNVVTQPIQYSSSVTELGILRYVGAIYHDKSAGGGTTRNQNVPDAAVFGSGDTTGANNPDRLLYDLRWSTGGAMPASTGDWDNGGYATAGTYTKFCLNQKPSFDNFGLPNSNPAFNFSNVAPIGATWIQVKITLTNAYLN